jgi:hypothetical protein
MGRNGGIGSQRAAAGSGPSGSDSGPVVGPGAGSSEPNRNHPPSEGGRVVEGSGPQVLTGGRNRQEVADQLRGSGEVTCSPWPCSTWCASGAAVTA